MNTQKNAAWYRHQSWHRQTIIPALMPCSNGAWRFLPLPDRAKHKQKKARNYAGLAAFHAIRCLAVPDAESFPSYDADYIPNQNNESGRVVERTFTASIETPFLPPKFVEEYERIVPGAGQKMFDMVVKQQEFNMEIKRHDMQLNEKSLERVITVDAANINEQKEASIIRGKEVAIKSRGQIFAFILTCCLIALSGFFAYID